MPKTSHRIQVRLLPLAVLLFMVIALPSARDQRVFAAEIDTNWNDATAPSASGLNIADDALRHLGTRQGQCFIWVKDVVQRATGATMDWGWCPFGCAMVVIG